MKKIVFIILLSVFGFAELPVYNYNYLPGTFYSSSNATGANPPANACPTGTVLKFNRSTTYSPPASRISKTSYSSVSISPTSSWFVKNGSSFPYVSSFYVEESPSYWYKYASVLEFICQQAESCREGFVWDPLQDKCVNEPCPTGTTWNEYRQVCTKCQPWQKEENLIGSEWFNGNQCVEMCDRYDTYVPSFNNIIGDFIDGLTPFSPAICKNTNPAKTKEECDAQTTTFLGRTVTRYHRWICAEYSPTYKYELAFYSFFNIPYGLGCHCYYNYQTPIFANPSNLPGSVGFMPRTSAPFFNTPKGPRLTGRNSYDNLLPDRNPEASYAGYSENSNTPRYNLSDNFADWINHDGSSIPRTSDGKPDIYGRNYDYIDTEIYHDPVTGKDTFVPKFELTGTNDDLSINLTSNSFSNTASANLPPDLPKIYPNTNFSNPTPELYQASYQTATKTQFNFDIPEPNLGDTVNVTANVPTSVAGSTPPTTRTYPMTVTGRTANSLGGYTTTYSYPSSVPGVPSYTVTTDSSSDGTTNVSVNTSTSLDDGTNVYYTHRTAYSYTVPTSGGPITSYGTSSSSFTSPDGSTTYTNPATNTGTTYNYQGSSQNLDELLNFKPEVKETSMDKPLEEMIKEEDKSIAFLQSLKQNFLDVKLSFENLFLKLQNPPTIHEKSGSCQVCFPFHGSVICKDWCQFISPYRSFITSFLIVVGTFFIGRFAVENLKS